jgi:ribosome biogenesis protein Nip4
MKRGGGYRDVTASEVGQIKETIDNAFGTGVMTALVKTGHLVRLEKKFPTVYWVSDPVYQMMEELHVGEPGEEGPHVQSVGIMVGFFRKGEFLIGVEQIREIGNVTEQWVEVTDQGEQRFLYGNHLQKQSITAVSGDLPSGARVIIRNRRKEALGIGVVVEAGLRSETLPAKREVVKHLTDLGTRYLRKGA